MPASSSLSTSPSMAFTALDSMSTCTLSRQIGQFYYLLIQLRMQSLWKICPQSVFINPHVSSSSQQMMHLMGSSSTSLWKASSAAYRADKRTRSSTDILRWARMARVSLMRASLAAVSSAIFFMRACSCSSCLIARSLIYENLTTSTLTDFFLGAIWLLFFECLRLKPFLAGDFFIFVCFVKFCLLFSII